MAQLQKTENTVSDLKTSLQEMPKDMRLFSLSMRALYSDQDVGSSTDASRKFRKLRDDTRQDALVYLKCILPVSTKFVSSISEYFEYYTALKYEEWCEMLPDILQETVAYKELAETVVQMYEQILVPLKKRQDEARIIMAEFKDLQREFDKKKKELEKSAGAKAGWAYGLAFVPFVNLIASPILAASSDNDMAKAIAQQAQSKIHEVAAITVSETLIPALNSFINGLTKAAGFFSVMEQELLKFESKAEKATVDPKKLYYKVMSKQAEDMKSICQTFYAVLPDVRTDFLAIPDGGTAQNYVDKWLEKQKKAIKEKHSIWKHFPHLFKAIEGGEGEAK